MIEPMLGIVLACDVPLVYDGVLSALSCGGAAGVGAGECECVWEFCCPLGEGAKSLGSIGVEAEFEGWEC